jgi:hypothetical protein
MGDAEGAIPKTRRHPTWVRNGAKFAILGLNPQIDHSHRHTEVERGDLTIDVPRGEALAQWSDAVHLGPARLRR